MGIKGYKGFNKDFQCVPNGTPFQYKIGETYTTDTAKLCSNGFHFCENPLDVLSYYGVAKGNRYAEVDGEEVSDEKGSDTKRASKVLHIGAEITLSALISAGVEFIFHKSSNTTDTTEAHSATAGDYAHSATAGDYAHSATAGNGAHSATAGDDAHSATAGNGAHSATAGDDAHSATAGDDAHSATAGYGAHSATAGNGAHSATAGDYAHSATAGDEAHSATAGNYAHSATAGNYAHSATAGNRANSATAGYGAHSATAGANAVAASVGPEAAAKAALGCWIVLAEWKDGVPVNVKCGKVDGKKIKADAWYKLQDNKFVETEV